MPHLNVCTFTVSYSRHGGPSSSVGIATGHELDVPGSKPVGGEIFRTCSYRPWSPPNLLENGYRFFPGGKNRPGMTLTTHPLLVPWSRKSRIIPLQNPRPVLSLSSCTRVHFTFFTVDMGLHPARQYSVYAGLLMCLLE